MKVWTVGIGVIGSCYFRGLTIDLFYVYNVHVWLSVTPNHWLNSPCSGLNRINSSTLIIFWEKKLNDKSVFYFLKKICTENDNQALVLQFTKQAVQTNERKQEEKACCIHCTWQFTEGFQHEDLVQNGNSSTLIRSHTFFAFFLN